MVIREESGGWGCLERGEHSFQFEVNECKYEGGYEDAKVECDVCDVATRPNTGKRGNGNPVSNSSSSVQGPARCQIQVRVPVLVLYVLVDRF